MSDPQTMQEIIRAAREDGVDPSLALAIAERESSMNPRSGGTGTIRGLYQMTAKSRNSSGTGLDDDAYGQTKGFGRFIKSVAAEMKQGGGRDFTGAELYAGHHFGGQRAGRMFNMDPDTPVDQVFTAREMEGNPHFARAGTVGNLLASVTSDIQRRQQKFGGSTDLPDLSAFGEAVGGSTSGSQARPAAPDVDLASFGEPVNPITVNAPSNAGSNAQAKPAALPDLSSMGTPLA